jgi:ubiquinone/menaquinone biosynthesis C-methylase UbiE/acyl carrier protein
MNTLAQGAYDVSTFSVDATAEMDRLNAQLDLFWDQELALYQRSGLRDGIRVLDCGCGPGLLLVKLHALYPGLQSAGIEVDPQLVDRARSVVAQKCPGVCQIFQQSITALAFPENSFDFIVARLVLEHLPDPTPAFNEILRVLKVGGRAVFVDNDFDFHERTFPNIAALEDLYAAYRSARRADRGNPAIGRELPLHLKKAGFASVDFHVIAAHSSVAGDVAFLRAEGAGIPVQLVKTGYLASDSFERVAKDWRSMITARDHAIVRVLFAASGQKLSSTMPVENSSTQVDSRVVEADSAKSHESSNPTASPAGVGSAADISGLIQTTLARELEVPLDSLPPDKPMISLGVDSMAAVALCSELETRFGISVPIEDVLAGKSITDFSTQVMALVK